MSDKKMQNDAVLKNQLNSKSPYLSTVMVDLLNSSYQDGFQFSIFKTNEVLNEPLEFLTNVKNSTDVINLTDKITDLK